MKLSTFFATVAVAFADIVADDVCVSNGREVSCDTEPTQPIVSLFLTCIESIYSIFSFFFQKNICRLDQAAQKATLR